MRIPNLLLIALIASACRGGDDADGEPDAAVHPERHVLLWVDPASGLEPEALREGCGRWDEIGVGCELVDDKAASDVQVYAETDECDPDGDGSYVLAYAGCCGPIVFRGDCFLFDDGSFDRKGAAIVMSHEVGHQFGLWWHVPRDCGPNAPEHPEEGPVCGKAVMNPYFDPSVPGPNAVDRLAFDLRNPDHSVVDAHNHHDGEEGFGTFDGDPCVFRNLPEASR